MAHPHQIDLSDIDQCPRFSQFTQLDTDEREIRLVRLSDDVKLEKYLLLTAPAYHAISYFWGSATPTRQICVQGEIVEIRETVSDLFEVLQDRYGYEALFWIDILCIDQRNLDERNSQVSMMCEIYSRATGVISWLGRSTLLSQSAFQIIRKRLFCPKNAPVRLWGSSQNYTFDAEHISWPSTQQLETDHDLYRSFAEVIVWPALADILRRSYWSRLWVMHEMIVAAKCVLLCGTDSIGLEDFVTVANLWIWNGQYYQKSNTDGSLDAVRTSTYQDVVNTWRPIEKIMDDYREQYKEDKILLMELVDSFASKECSNIRDKVFALRSLSKEAANIRVDYSKTVLEVFLSLVQSGLLMSDGGRGFQSLPYLIRCLGIDHGTINKQLAGLPRTLIHLDGRPIGKVVTATKPGHGLGAGQLEHFEEGAYIQAVVKGQLEDQQVEHYRCSEIERASQFLENVQPGDIMCTTQTASPILLLLRLRRYSEVDIAYNAIDNLHNWTSEWNPLAKLPLGACIIGEVHVSRTAGLDCSQSQDFSIASDSLRGLALWEETEDKWYYRAHPIGVSSVLDPGPA